MRLATLKEGGRDGVLVVVSRDLQRAVRVMDIAKTLQKALDDWDNAGPRLEVLYKQLSAGAAIDGAFAFNPKKALSPLPRAYQWLDGSTYVNHVELVRKSRGMDVSDAIWKEPLMYQGCSDSFHAPYDDLPYVTVEDWGVDFEGEIAVIVDNVPMGISAHEAEKHIKLVMLCNDVSLRRLAAPELAKGLGFVQAKPPSSFAPVAVSPKSLGAYWQDGKLHRQVRSFVNGKLFGQPNAGVEMAFNFPQLIAHAARTRPLAAGTIIGSGSVSNKGRADGASCILEKTLQEKLENREILTAFLHSGDTVKLEVLDDYHHPIFGTIEHTIIPYPSPARSQ